MENKSCCGCKKIVSVNSFHKDKYSKDGYTSRCKKCRKEQNKKWLQRDPDHARNIKRMAQHKWRKNNTQYMMGWVMENKDHLLKYNKVWRSENKDKIKLYNQKQYKENREIILEKNKVYLDNNIKKVRKAQLKRHRYRYKHDIRYKLSCLLRSRVRKIVKGSLKSGSAVKDLGCSVKKLEVYLKSKFQLGMSWDNHGKWHIDHIKPLASFDLTSRGQFLDACHYTNLQPLWAKDNLSKGAKI